MQTAVKEIKIECRLDLFGASSWEYSHIGDLSLCLQHHPCLLSLPISSNAQLITLSAPLSLLQKLWPNFQKPSAAYLKQQQNDGASYLQ